MTANPAEGIETPRIARSLPTRLTRQQAQRLLDVTENYPWPSRFLQCRNHAIVAVFLFAGLRKSELLKLHMVDVDFDSPAILVKRGKGSKDRIVPMNLTLRAIVRRYVEERRRLGKSCPEVFTSSIRNAPLTEQGLKRITAALTSATGQRLHVHMLRHTFATLMLEGGCDIYALSRMMGHSDIKTTTIYLAASAAHLQAQIRKHPLDVHIPSC